MNGVKQKHILSMLQTGYTTVQVQFPNYHTTSVDTDAPRGKTVAIPPWQEAHNGTPPDSNWNQPRPRHAPAPVAAPVPDLYTYKAKLSQNVQAGDSVVVEVRGRLVLALVHSVDEAPRIDTDSDYAYKWVVQRVDMTEYRQAEADEQTFEDTLAAIEREKARAATLASFMSNMPEGSRERELFNSACGRLQLSAPATSAPLPQAWSTDPNVSGRPLMPAQEGMQCK